MPSKPSETLVPNIIASVESEPKSGKTYFSMTFPEPIFLMSFDVGADYVKRRYFPDKDITIEKYVLPIQESTSSVVKGAEDVWNLVKTDFDVAVDSGKYRTIVLDTGTTLWDLAQMAYKEKNDKLKIAPLGYTEPNVWMTSLVTKAQLMGINLVITHHIKPEWIDNQQTGRMKTDGCKRVAGLCDIIMRVERTGERENTKMKFTITDNRYDRNLDGATLIDATYDDLVAMIGL